MPTGNVSIFRPHRINAVVLHPNGISLSPDLSRLRSSVALLPERTPDRIDHFCQILTDAFGAIAGRMHWPAAS